MTEEAVKKSDLDEFLDTHDVTGAVSINPADITNELLRMASLFVRFGVLAARARKQRDTRKTRLELQEAKLDRKIRAELASKGEKATEKTVASMLIVQSSYQAAQEELAEATEICSVAETTLNALSMKRDMLVQLNKNLEREWDATSTRIPVNREQLKDQLAKNLAAIGSS